MHVDVPLKEGVLEGEAVVEMVGDMEPADKQAPKTSFACLQN